MLYDAITNYSDYDILIKQHPDAIKGGKSSYFSDEKLAFARYTDNIIPINFDVNPYSLFAIVEEVFVGTSGMGFEALLAGKKVHCYGAPFYSGWGLTIDHVNISRRNINRSLEVVFYLAYIESSRYYSPILKQVCSVEQVINDVMSLRGW
jgi:capsule polysaccharide export protein KpsC/LpsZ